MKNGLFCAYINNKSHSKKNNCLILGLANLKSYGALFDRSRFILAGFEIFLELPILGANIQPVMATQSTLLHYAILYYTL